MLPFALLALLLAGLAHLASAKRLAGEGFHFLVLQRDGQVFAVGRNGEGQLGLGTTTHALLPQRMLSVTNATDVSAGFLHSCLEDQGGQVRCAGSNNNYQLGDGTDADTQVPVPALGLDSGVVEVYGGSYGSCVRTAGGAAQCWGLFANSVKASPANITIPGGTQSVSLGYSHACFVAVGGKLYCMGWDAYGQLGTGNTNPQTEPTPVVGLAAEHIVSVACGVRHTCAVNADGAMFCWGEDASGRLGNPSVTSNSPDPVQVLGITSGAASAWTGQYNSFALMQNGTVWAFGKDQYGVFGTGSTANQAVPVVFGEGVSGVVEIRGGYFATCVFLQNDEIKCTGDNYYGQLGLGSTTDSLTLVEMQWPTSAPTAVPTLAPILIPTLVPTFSPSGAVALHANFGAVAGGVLALLFL